MDSNALLSELVASLYEESDALAAGDTERLSLVAQRKGSLLARLAPELRHVGHGDSPLDRAQLRHAQRINEGNAELLAAQINAVRARSDALLGASRGPTVYTAGGAVSAASRPATARAAA